MNRDNTPLGRAPKSVEADRAAIRDLRAARAEAEAKIAACCGQMADAQEKLTPLLAETNVTLYVRAARKAWRLSIKAYKASIKAYEGDIRRCDAEIAAVLKREPKAESH